jgi:hypothetical protein
MNPLELFFKDSSHFRPRLDLFRGIPTPFPTVGRGADLKPSFVHKSFVAVLVFACTPDFGRFYGSRGGIKFVWMPRSPKTSLVAHAPTTGSPTDGLR